MKTSTIKLYLRFAYRGHRELRFKRPYKYKEGQGDLCILWVLFGLGSKRSKPSPWPYESPVTMNKFSQPLTELGWWALCICFETVSPTAFVLSPSRTHFLKTLSCCLKHGGFVSTWWRRTESVVTISPQVACFSHVRTARQPSWCLWVRRHLLLSLQKCTSALSKPRGANSAPSLATFFSNVFSKWFLTETLVEDGKLKFSPEASDSCLENCLRSLPSATEA